MFQAIGEGDFRDVINGMSADLAASAAMASSSSAAAGQFEVDLQALYDHYYDVMRVREQLFKRMQKLSEQSMSSCHSTYSEITGVADSFKATWDGAVGGSSGDNMMSSLRYVLGTIDKYADGVAEVYKAYVHADSEGSSSLTAAADPSAAAVGMK